MPMEYFVILHLLRDRVISPYINMYIIMYSTVLASIDWFCKKNFQSPRCRATGLYLII